MTRVSGSALWLAMLVAASPEHAGAGGPLNSHKGAPVRYRALTPISFHTDQGPLGSIDNASATNLAVEGFQRWENVSTATIAFSHAGQLPEDVDAGNYLTYLNNFTDGINPIIFDSDGGITAALFGSGSENSIIGFAGSAYATSGPDEGFYVEGQAVINGKFSSVFPPEEFLATFVHEFGHFLGLDHSQINAPFASDGNTANDVYLPTMFPTSTDNDTALVSLNPDDIAAVSALYPAASFSLVTGTIAGTALRIDSSPVRGANVVAISTTDSLYTRISTVTDYLVQNTGDFVVRGLAPGTYWVRMEPIRPAFTGGSSVGPYARDLNDLSFLNPVQAEYYNGPNESSDPDIDDPNERTEITVTAGSPTPGITFAANVVPDAPALSVIEYHTQPTYV
ncbi:MAG: matrixin family metalloprotease, partial [Bacteroidota bacterium]